MSHQPPSRLHLVQLLVTDPEIDSGLAQILADELVRRCSTEQLFSLSVQLNKTCCTGFLSRTVSIWLKARRWDELGGSLKARWPEVYQNRALSETDIKKLVRLYNIDLIGHYNAIQLNLARPLLEVIEEENLEYALKYPLIDTVSTTPNEPRSLITELREGKKIEPYSSVQVWGILN